MAANLNLIVDGVAKTIAAKPYAFPKKGNLPADYTLTLNGEKATIARTGGGTYPTYIYIMIGKKPYYLPANVTPDNGSDITVAPIGAKLVPSGDALKKELADAGVTVEQAIEAAKVIEAEAKPAKPARRKAAK